MDLGLKGKRAIITGATRGIGRAIADALAAEGVDLGICARSASAVRDAVASYGNHGVRVCGSAVDIADGDSLKGWVRTVCEAYGGLDILVINASAMSDGNSEEAWQAAFQIDVLGAVRAVTEAMPFLEATAAETGDACVVIVSSAGAGEAKYANAYTAMKAAPIQFVKGLAYEKAAKHVRVNTVSPGPVYFEGGIWNQIEQANPEMYKTYLGAIPTGRMATPEDVAKAVVFLSSTASSFTTGANMLIDGAYSSRVTL
ncbi:MAG TPA: SDR family oxidoreductase [Rhizomicrobium sp.]|jgi:3-oxoacyl-[acyl-carrier protein] reductase|nr:SDR family oxidoreductase [Rhizomicrobium sp.]